MLIKLVVVNILVNSFHSERRRSCAVHNAQRSCPTGYSEIFVVISAICIITAMAVSLPATIDFVTFMSIEKTSLLKLRFDYVFSIYIIFSAAIISRYLWRLLDLLRGQDRERTK